MSKARSFAIPAQMPDLSGTEGWREMYPEYMVFSNSNRDQIEFESSRFWFLDSVHSPFALSPLDAYSPDMWSLPLAQAANRIYMVPPARGVHQRIYNGYLYLSPQGVEDPNEVGARAQLFEKRAGYCFHNWDEIYSRWSERMEWVAKEMESVNFSRLPDIEPESTVTEDRGYGEGYRLVREYDRFWSTILISWQYHFELLNLAYGAYAVYAQGMHALFPGITDSALGKCVAGFHAKLFRPPEELQKLAKKATELGIADAILASKHWPELVEKLQGNAAGKEWLASLEAVRYPWFEMSSGIGWYYHEPTWNQNLEVPLANIKRYIEAIRAGKQIMRPSQDVIAERSRYVAEYRSLITNEHDLATFDQLVGTALKVAPYAEDHNWYCSNYEHAIFFRKMRELGSVLAEDGIVTEPDDIFYFNRHEISPVLFDLCACWAVGARARSSYYWPARLARRKKIVEIFRNWTAPPALGPAPDIMTEPITISMWGITTEIINQWLDVGRRSEAGQVDRLSGCAASAGVIEGVARVCRSTDDISLLKIGEVLVVATTSPNWAPAFQCVAACVTDVGGPFSHAAIVAREYGMPAVLGTGFATQTIRTGDRLRVDGDKGMVTILERAAAASA